MEPDIKSFTDGELERLAAGGNRDAFGELYERYSGRVYDFLLRMVRDEEEAADLMQETFIRAMKALSTEKAGGASFSTWLFTIARNLALTRLERSRRTVPLAEEQEEGGEESSAYQHADPSRFADPQEAAEATEMAGLVWQAAAALDPKQHSLLDLHIRQGLDSAEIAVVLKVSKGNAYTMLSRLKDAFEEAVASLLMFQRGRRYCAQLDRLIKEYRLEGISASARKLISRHTSECAICQEQRRRLVSAEAVLRSLTPLPLPLLLKQRVAEAAMQSWLTAAATAAKGGILKSLWAQSGGRMAGASAGLKAAAGGALLATVVGGSIGGWLFAGGAGGSEPSAATFAPVREVAPIVVEPSPTATLTLTPTLTPTASPTATLPPPPPPPPAPPPAPTPMLLPPTPQPMSCPAPFPQPQLPPGYVCSEISAAPSGESEGFNAQLEQSIIQLENGYRATLGLSPLQYDPRLGQAARGFAKQLVDNGWVGPGYMAVGNHTGPDGRTLLMRLGDVGLVRGENLYWASENDYWGVNSASACRIFPNLSELHLRNIAADCLYGAPEGPYYGIGCYFRYAPQLQFVCVVDYAALM